MVINMIELRDGIKLMLYYVKNKQNLEEEVKQILQKYGLTEDLTKDISFRLLNC